VGSVLAVWPGSYSTRRTGRLDVVNVVPSGVTAADQSDVTTGRLSSFLPDQDQEGSMLQVRLDEILTSRAAARELPQALDRLEHGDAEQLVIMRRSEPRAVLITVERYQQLLASCQHLPATG
jgi:hypothetical protein